MEQVEGIVADRYQSQKAVAKACSFWASTTGGVKCIKLRQQACQFSDMLVSEPHSEGAGRVRC